MQNPLEHFLADLATKIQTAKEYKEIVKDSQNVDVNKNVFEGFITGVADTIKKELANRPSEILETTAVSSVPATEPEPDPFEKFASTLATTISANKDKIVEKKKTEESEEQVPPQPEPEKQKEPEQDSFVKFIGNLKDIITKEPVEKPKPTKIEKEKAVGANDYVSELKKDTKDPVAAKELVNPKTKDELIKELVRKFVEGEIKNFKDEVTQKINQVGGAYGGGGGTNAVQYANGGTMDGNLNVNGNILSGGKNLSDYFGGGGGGGNQTLSFNQTNYDLSISSGNTVNLGVLKDNLSEISSASASWNTAYTNLIYNSASYLSGFNSTAITQNSASWNTAYTNLIYNSASYLSGFNYSLLAINSAGWENTETTVNSYSANWQTGFNNPIYSVYGTSNQIVVTSGGSYGANNYVTLSFPTSVFFPGNVNIAGNLVVAGSAAFINVKDFVVSDNIIYFAANNPANVLDIGIVGAFTDTGLGYQHAGLIRRAGQNSPGVWTLFAGLTTEPVSGSNINWDDYTFRIETFQANLSSDFVNTKNLSANDGFFSNNVGIGVAAPLRKFHQQGGKLLINSDSGSWGQLQITNPGVGETSMVFANNATINSNGSLASSQDDYIWNVGLGSYANDANKFIIGNNGYDAVLTILQDKVGIGTTAPATKLHVAGYSDDVNTPIQIIESTGSQAPYTFRVSNTDQAYVKGDNAGNLALGAQNFIALETGGFGGAHEAVRVLATGEVGIGTTTPNTPLDVNGVITATGGNSNQWNASYTNLIYNSASYLSGFNSTAITQNSANWNTAYTNLVNNSSNYLSGASFSYVNSTFVKLSGDTMTGTLSVGSGGNLFSPSFATFVKNSSYITLSSTLTDNSLYFNSLATFASPGGFIIKGHSPEYNTSIQNLPGYGTYGLWLQGVDNMDPGTTFVSDGRAQVTHAMAFRAGINNFTAGSDHNHVQWQGAPSNNTQAWQMTNGGSLGVYGYGNNTYSQRFLVHTLPQYQISTTIAATSGYFDTRNANLITNTDRVSGVVILLDTTFGAGNYNLITPGSVVGVTLNPGLVGLVAVIYNSQCTQVSSNGGSLSAFQFDFFIGNNNNWVPAQKGIQPVNLKSRANGGNPGVSLITSQIGTNPSTQYVGITGCYRNMTKHALARFSTSSILTGFKPGSPLTLWIPTDMPSSSPIGTGFITSDKISTFAQGTFPTGVRTGYFDAYVINVSGTDIEFALCNLMDSYGFENRTWPFSAAGNAGWVLYGGSQDTVHRPTFGTTGFYFEREPWYFDGTNYLSGGMVKCVGLGNSEVYGNFSYGLGFRGAVLGQKSGTFAGDYNAVYSDNSVALGGEGLISLSSTPYQAVIGKYNNPNNNALFVVGTGTSNTSRSNVLEVNSSNLTVAGNISATQGIVCAPSTFTASDTVTDAALIMDFTRGASTGGMYVRRSNGQQRSIFNYQDSAGNIDVGTFSNNINSVSIKAGGSNLTGYINFGTFSTNNTMRIIDSGNIGIGTVTPNEKLTVVGNISSSRIIYASGGNSDLWNTAYTNLVGNSANYLSGISINTVQTYLSTNNVQLSSCTITGNLSVLGTIYSTVSAYVTKTLSTIIGDGVNTSYTITHNFGTTDVQVAVYDAGTNVQSFPTVTISNGNTITLGFAIAPGVGAYRVVILGAVPSNNVVAYGPTVGTLASLAFAASDELANITTGNAKITFTIPQGFNLTKIKGGLNTAATGSSLIFSLSSQTNNNTAGTVTMPVGTLVADASVNYACLENDRMCINVSQVGSTTPGTGLKVYLIGRYI